MATTWLQLLNRVLRPLGEDQIATGATALSTDYNKLLSSFANQIKEEIEDAHNWRVLRTEFTVTVTAGSTSTTIDTPSAPSERARVYRIQDSNTGALVPLCFDTTDSNNPYQIAEMDLPAILHRIQLETGSNYDYPSGFALDSSSGEVTKLVTYPPCAADRTIKITLIDPQAWVEDDAISTVIKIPTRPLMIGTLWYALEERGEELGINAMFSEERYRKALDEAIARDMAEQGGMDLVPV